MIWPEGAKDLNKQGSQEVQAANPQMRTGSELKIVLDVLLTEKIF